MGKYWSEDFYNSSAIYQEGLKVKKDVEDFRSRVAKIIGVGSKEIVFTAGGTESINLAILGAFEESLKTFKKPHIIVSAIEHPAVVAAAEEVVRRGGELSGAPVNEEGVISLPAFKKLLKKSTFLISIGLANSEIGTIQPIAKIGRLVKELRKERESSYPLLHTDASPCPSYLDIKLETLNSDLLTVDSSKIYGPKSAGILALRKGVKIHPIIFGGGQEKGRRAGTLNPALIAGFTSALEAAIRDKESEAKRLEILRQRFINHCVKRLPSIIVNGSSESHLPNIISISVPGILGEFLLLRLEKRGVLVSVGSACSVDAQESGSPVIKALGKDDLKESTLRFSFGRFTTEDELRRAAEIFVSTLNL